MSQSQIVTPPHPKKRLGTNAETTHMRVYRRTLDDLHEVADAWNTSLLEAQRYLVELAKTGEIENPASASTQ